MDKGIVSSEQLQKIEEYFLSCQTVEPEKVSKKRNPTESTESGDTTELKRRVESDDKVNDSNHS